MTLAAAVLNKYLTKNKATGEPTYHGPLAAVPHQVNDRLLSDQPPYFLFSALWPVAIGVTPLSFLAGGAKYTTKPLWGGDEPQYNRGGYIFGGFTRNQKRSRPVRSQPTPREKKIPYIGRTASGLHVWTPTQQASRTKNQKPKKASVTNLPNHEREGGHAFAVTLFAGGK